MSNYHDDKWRSTGRLRETGFGVLTEILMCFDDLGTLARLMQPKTMMSSKDFLKRVSLYVFICDVIERSCHLILHITDCTVKLSL